MNEENQPGNVNSSIPTQPEVEHELAKISSNPRYWILIIAIIVIIIILYFGISWFFRSKIVQTSDSLGSGNILKTSSQEQIVIPSLPEPPKLVTPAPPPPPPVVKDEPAPINNAPKSQVNTSSPSPALPVAQNLPLTNVAQPSQSVLPSILPDKTLSEDEKKRRDAKRKSSIILIQGKVDEKTLADETKGEFVELKSLELTLTKGKMIDAVIESAVDSALASDIRAIISTDVYSEFGNNILIPKGSKAMGSFTSGTGTPVGRLSIAWTRVLLPSGYILNLTSTSTYDNLGRSGVTGRVDYKIKEQLANTFLTSAINIGVGKALDKIVTPTSNSTVTATGANNSTIIAAANNLYSTLSSSVTSNPSTVITQICQSAISAAGTDTATSTQITAWCATAQNSPSTSSLATLMQNIQALSTANAASVVTATNSQAQSAVQQSFNNIGNTLQNINSKTSYDTEVTLEQGTPIKIMVNKDIIFPKNALLPRKIMP